MWSGARPRLPSVCIRKSHTTPVRTNMGIGTEQKDDLVAIGRSYCGFYQHPCILIRAKLYRQVQARARSEGLKATASREIAHEAAKRWEAA
jgi:hypothetical protein